MRLTFARCREFAKNNNIRVQREGKQFVVFDELNHGTQEVCYNVKEVAQAINGFIWEQKNTLFT